MNSLLRTCMRGVLSAKRNVRQLSGTVRLLNKQDDEQTKKEFRYQKIWQDEWFEPDPYLASGKTEVTMLSQEEKEVIMFESFSSTGFLLNNGLRVIGPVAAFPRSVLHWNIGKVEHINKESLSLFTMLEPKIDILVVGVGEQANKKRVDTSIIQFLRSHRISVEILNTENALATFNFLNQERRYVAGAFLPPSFVDTLDDHDHWESHVASLGNEGIDELMNVPIEMPPSPFDPFIEEGKGIRPEIHEYAARDWVELRPDKTVPEDKVIGVIPRKRDIEAKKKEEEEREKAEKENGEKRNKTLVADELSHPGD